MNLNLIEINLSDKFKQRKKKSAPVFKTPNALGILILVIIVAFGITHLTLQFQENNLKKMNEKYKELKTPARETSKLKKMCSILEKKYKILKISKENRLVLSDKWLEIAYRTPDSIFLQQIKISNENKLNGKQNILICGKMSGKEGESVILSYLEALKASKIFNTEFQMVLSPIYTEGNEKVFSINLIQ